MATESSSWKGEIESPVQLLKRLEKHDWDFARSDSPSDWRTGQDNWDAIKKGVRIVPNGKAIFKHYVAARNLAYYGHE